MQVNAHGIHGGRPGCGLLSLAAKGLLFLRTIAFAEQRAASVWIVSTVSVRSSGILLRQISYERAFLRAGFLARPG